MTRGLRTACSVCQDTTISEEASAPNCRCSPATGGVVIGSGGGGATGTARAAPTPPIRDAATAVPPAIPAAASSLRRLSSRLISVSRLVMAAGLLHGGCTTLSQLDDSSTSRSRSSLATLRRNKHLFKTRLTTAST